MTTHHLRLRSRLDLPRSGAGRWAAGLLMLAALSLGALVAAFTVAPPTSDALTGDPWLTAPALLTVVSAVLGGAFGTFALLRRHDQSAWVVTAVTVGGAVVALLVGELAVPH